MAFRRGSAALLGFMLCRGAPPEVCSPAALEVANCPKVEHGINWEEFLVDACAHCPQNKPCTLGAQDPALETAVRIIGGEDTRNMAFQCISGLLSAMIIVAQHYLVRAPEELEGLLNQSISLAPFPFHSMQYSLYTNMVPVRLMHCGSFEERALENRYVPKAHPEDSGICGVVYTDDQLVRRCKARRKMVPRNETRLDILRSLTCPATGAISVDAELHRKIHKYIERAETLQCQTSRGMWREEMSDVHKCVLITVAQFMGFRPGELVLDWGSGCGHKLTWAKQLFDVDGLGVDIMGAAVSWAQTHSLGSFCHIDGRHLDWIPDELFDHVISYAAIYHMSKEDQCETGIKLVRKLRIGGRAFLGWNHGTVMTSWEWLSCFRASAAAAEAEEEGGAGPPAGVSVDFEAIEDGFFFPPDARMLQTSKSFLFQYPAYSIFLTRLSVEKRRLLHVYEHV